MNEFGDCSITGADSNDTQKAAKSIHDHFDPETLKRTLLDMSADERRDLKDSYKKMYGVDLEERLHSQFGGAQGNELALYLNRSDEKGSVSSGLLKVWSDELGSTSGNDKGSVENKILRQVQAMNSKDLESLDPAVRSELEKRLSPGAREAFDIYAKGSDRRTVDDELKLASLAMDSSDIERFKMVMSGAKSETRQALGTPEYQERLEKAFGADPNQLKHARDYAEIGTRGADTKVLDNVKFLGDDEEQIEKSLRELTPEQRAAYKHGKQLAMDVQTKGSDVRDSWSEQDKRDYQFHDKLQSALLTATEGGDAQAEFQKYEKVILFDDSPKSPQDKLISRLSQASDGPAAIGALQDAFRDDPQLRTRIQEDAALKEKVDSALKRVLGDKDYEQYGKPLLENGSLPAQDVQRLNSGWMDDNEARFYRGMADLGVATDSESVAEKKRILEDKQYQDKIFSHLNEDERQVALNALRQGKMAPEDQMRSLILNSQEDKEALSDTLSHLSTSEKEQMKQAYDTKYGDWRADLNGLSKEDQKLLSSALNSHELGMQDEHALLTQERSGTRDSGFSHKVDKYWDGTGHDVDDKLNRVTNVVENSSAQGAEVDSQEMRKLKKDFASSMADHIRSKGAAANTVADAAVAVASVGLAVPTGGVSLGLLAKSAAVSGAIRVGTKAYLLGDNYDASQAAKDATVGSVEGATGAIGGGLVGQMLKVGKGAAANTATEVAANLGDDALKEGGKEALESGLQDVVRDAVTSGADNIDPAKIQELARRVSSSSDPAHQAQIAEAIQKSLDGNLTKGSHGLIADAVDQSKLEAGAGAIQGVSASAVYSLGEWDANKSVTENASMVGTSVLVAGMTGGIGGRFGHHSDGLAGKVEVRLGRPEAELEAKVSKLKGDLGINMWDTPSAQRQKLIADLDENNRIQYHEGRDGNIVIDNGNTRLYLADQLGVPHEQITVHTSEGKKTLAQIEKEYADKRSAPAETGVERSHNNGSNTADAPAQKGERGSTDDTKIVGKPNTVESAAPVAEPSIGVTTELLPDRRNIVEKGIGIKAGDSLEDRRAQFLEYQTKSYNALSIKDSGGEPKFSTPLYDETYFYARKVLGLSDAEIKVKGPDGAVKSMADYKRNVAGVPEQSGVAEVKTTADSSSQVAHSSGPGAIDESQVSASEKSDTSAQKENPAEGLDTNANTKPQQMVELAMFRDVQQSEELGKFDKLKADLLTDGAVRDGVYMQSDIENLPQWKKSEYIRNELAEQLKSVPPRVEISMVDGVPTVTQGQTRFGLAHNQYIVDEQEIMAQTPLGVMSVQEFRQRWSRGERQT